jgi:Fe-S oxidoreductase
MLTIHKPNSEIQAKTLYSNLEKDIKENNLEKEVVMVSAEDIKAIKKAYPNYFLDSEKFVKHIINFLPKKGEIWEKINRELKWTDNIIKKAHKESKRAG